MKRIGIFLVICHLLISCASVSTNLYRNSPTYPPSDPSKVGVFHQKPQNENFIEIGEVTVSDVYSWKEVEKELKKAAAKWGGDAVYIISQNMKGEGVLTSGYKSAVGVINTQMIVTGVVIKYKD
jgi:hypothetical protein